MEIECNVKYRWPLSWLLKAKTKKVEVESVKNLMAKFRRRKFVSKIRAKIAGGQKIIRG